MAEAAPLQQERGFDLATAKSKLAPVLAQLAPAVVVVGRALDALGPYLQFCYEFGQHAWSWAEPYHPEDLLECFLGLLLLLFGGNFPTTLAAVEAFRIIGFASTRAALLELWVSYQAAREASRKDALADSDKDGVADVQEMEARQLVTHKIKLVLKSTDPDRVSRGLSGVWSGCAAVVAALRMRMAFTLTIGISVGDIFATTLDYTLRPALLATIPGEYHKWLGLGTTWFARIIGFAVAWSLQRVLSAFHSALRGAELLVFGLLKFAERHGATPPIPPTSPLVPAVCAVVGFVGFYTQWRAGFALPFPLNLLLLPLRVFEWGLYSYVASTTTYAPYGHSVPAA